MIQNDGQYNQVIIKLKAVAKALALFAIKAKAYLHVAALRPEQIAGKQAENK